MTFYFGKMRTIRLLISTHYLVIFAVVVGGINEDGFEGEDFCQDKAHYNTLSSTCCKFKRFDPVKINPFKNEGHMKECSENVEKATKLTTKSWMIYKCLIEKLVKPPVTLESFSEFMIGRFGNDNEIKTAIKNSLKIVKQSLPKTLRRKKRTPEGEDTATVASDPTTLASDPTTLASDPTTLASDPTTLASDPTTLESDPTTLASDPTTLESDPTTIASDPTTLESDPTTLASDPTTIATDPTTIATDPTTTANDPATTTESFIAKYKVHNTVFSYLSVFDYFDFKNYNNVFPDEDFVRIWDAYFSAEFEACQKLSGKDNDTIISYNANRCFSWIQRSVRGGECCAAAPVPMPLWNEPIFDLETVLNYTADNLLSLGGKYTWPNYTTSPNIMRCYKLATVLMLKEVKLEDFTKDIDSYIENNGTEGYIPKYEKIVRTLIPHFYPKELKADIQKVILPERDPKEDEDQFYQVLTRDADIQRISNFSYSEYQWAAPHEWEDIDQNRTRFIMWSCDYYRMISQRLRYFDISPKLGNKISIKSKASVVEMIPLRISTFYRAVF